MPYTNTAFQRDLSIGWGIQEKSKIHESGECISLPQFCALDWYATTVPGTVLNTLVKHGEYHDYYCGKNLETISRERYQQSWWYRTGFELVEDHADKTVLLEFDGINYSADIWLNGQRVKQSREIKGAFRRFQMDVSAFCHSGKNVLAVEVFPPAEGDFTVGFVDWNPPPPDQNMGLFRPVRLRFCHGVSIEKPFVQSMLSLPQLDQSSLTVSAELVNHTMEKKQGVLRGWIGDLRFEQSVTLQPREVKTVFFSPEDYTQLHLSNPRVWWPHTIGTPHLYDLQLRFDMEAGVSDEARVSFGIRDVCDYFTPEGHRGFEINGKKILITGAGWTDDLFLGDTPTTIDTQLRYVRDMNLNSIRLEGIWGKDHTLYDLCDRYGILIMVGWSCHWEHEQYVGKEVDNRYGGVNAPEEIALIGQSWEDQVVWLRNHPSIYVWAVASDKVPHPELEKRYIETFQTYEPTRPYLCSTGGVGSDQHIIGDVEIVSDVSGTSGIKMLGPYAYTPPVYWYTDTARGGAFGFNSETGPGAQAPVLESIKRMIPEEHLWPPDEVWDYHCALNEFDTLDRFMTAMEKRYGAPATLDEFDLKAQMLNYELMRPMFEAFHAYKKKSTGIIHWMLNAAWPKMYWQLYDWFLKPNAAYYAVKKACNPLHILYNYGDASIYLVNNTFQEHPNCQAEIRVYDVDSTPLLMESIRLDLKADSSTNLFTLPSFLFLSSTYFLDLRLRDEDGQCLETNFYWLSTKPDVLDYDAKVKPWAFYTPSKAYADLTQLNNLAKATIQVRQEWTETGEQRKVTVELCNDSDCIAFFINATLLDEESGQRLHPVFWDDNYIHLLPKETRTLVVVFDAMVLRPRLVVQGWNTTITMM